MRTRNYRIFFVVGYEDVNAIGEAEAIILAQARRIEAGAAWAVVGIQPTQEDADSRKSTELPP